MSASIDDIIATAATHLLMVKRHTPEQVADYLIRMADQTLRGHYEPYPLVDVKTTAGRWAEAKATGIVRNESLTRQ